MEVPFGVVPAVVATEAWPNIVPELSVAAVPGVRGLPDVGRFEDMTAV